MLPVCAMYVRQVGVYLEFGCQDKAPFCFHVVHNPVICPLQSLLAPLLLPRYPLYQYCLRYCYHLVASCSCPPLASSPPMAAFYLSVTTCRKYGAIGKQHSPAGCKAWLLGNAPGPLSHLHPTSTARPGLALDSVPCQTL